MRGCVSSTKTNKEVTLSRLRCQLQKELLEFSRRVISLLIEKPDSFLLPKNIPINFHARPWCSNHISIHLSPLHNQTRATPSTSLPATYSKSLFKRSRRGRGNFTEWFLLCSATAVLDYIQMEFRRTKDCVKVYFTMSGCQFWFPIWNHFWAVWIGMGYIDRLVMFSWNLLVFKPQRFSVEELHCL